MFYLNFQLMEPMHILNVALRIDDEIEDASLSAMYAKFCAERRTLLQEACIRRVTFVSLFKVSRTSLM